MCQVLNGRNGRPSSVSFGISEFREKNGIIAVWYGTDLISPHVGWRFCYGTTFSSKRGNIYGILSSRRHDTNVDNLWKLNGYLRQQTIISSLGSASSKDTVLKIAKRLEQKWVSFPPPIMQNEPRKVWLPSSKSISLYFRHIPLHPYACMCSKVSPSFVINLSSSDL